MPSIAYYKEQFRRIATGHDNVTGLQPLHRLSKPLFASYNRGFPVQWHDSESRELDASRRFQRIGLPWEEWTLPVIAICEIEYLFSTFGSTEDVLVTIKTLNKRTLTWGVYNATMVYPVLGEIQDLGADYAPFTLEMRDLRPVV